MVTTCAVTTCSLPGPRRQNRCASLHAPASGWTTLANGRPNPCASILKATTTYHANDSASVVARASRAVCKQHPQHKRHTNTLPGVLANTFVGFACKVLAGIAHGFLEIARPFAGEIQLLLKPFARFFNFGTSVLGR